MTRDEAVMRAKEFRRDADALLQRMKEHRESLTLEAWREDTEPKDLGEVVAQHVISIRELEGAIMRQGMVLKNLVDGKPYPESYDPSSRRVEATADGLKL